MTIDKQIILDFWFKEISAKDWFSKNAQLDQMIIDRFSLLHQKAAIGELWQWRDSPEGRLAEIIILDQLSRNMFRGSAQSFEYDSLALILAQEAVRCNDHLKLNGPKRAFMLIPYMHSESLIIHQQAVKLFSVVGLESNLEYEYKHLEIIKKFGRYPHRNKLLNRQSTQEEIEFLKKHSGF